MRGTGSAMHAAGWTLAVLLAVGGIGTADAGATLDRVKADKVLVEVTDSGYPPFSSLNDQNEVVGADIDIAAEVAKRLGVGLRIETPAWEITTVGRWQGRYDVCICSMTPTKERAEVLDFVVRYYGAPAVIAVHKGDGRIKSAKDLTGMKVGVQAGSSYERYLNKTLVLEAPGAEPIQFPFGDVEIVPYPDEEQAYADLALGAGKRLDAVVGNFLPANDRVQKGLPFAVVEQPIYDEPIWVATDKGDLEFDAKIKEIILAMKADGTLTRIFEKWVGTDISQ